MSRASRMWIVMALVLLVALALTGCMRSGREDLLAGEPTEEGGAGVLVIPSSTPEGEITGGETVATPAGATATTEVDSGGGIATGDATATPLGGSYPSPASPSTPAPGVSPETGMVTPQPQETTIAISSPEAGIEITPEPEVGTAGLATPVPSGEGTTAPTPTEGTYIVQAGDTLFSIATRQGTTVDQIRAMNGLTTNFIYVGQELKVPGATSGSGATPPSTAGTPGTVVHTVQRGEWLYAIARQYGTTPEAIMRANGLNNPNLIYVGQQLTIPGQGAAPSSPAPSTGGASGQVHTVAAGDTLFSIALRYGTTVEALRARNALGSNIIYVGQQIAIP